MWKPRCDLLAALALLGTICVLGCGRSQPAQVAGQPESTAAPIAPNASEDSLTNESDAATAVEPETEPEAALPVTAAEAEALVQDAEPDVASDVVAEGPSETSDDSTVVEEPELGPAERILLLSAVGPLVIDLHISLEGVPYQQAFDQLLQEVMLLGDANEDGVVMWDELMGHPRFRYGQFGNPATGTYENQLDMKRLYDTRKNDRVDQDELARYLTSNQGIGRAMSFTTSEADREARRVESPVKLLLDTDGDDELSAQEIAQAASRLRMRDANDDEILVPADFAGTGLQQPGMMMTSRRSSSEIYRPNTAWRLWEESMWSDLLVGLREMYGFGGDPRAEDFLLTSDLFRELDLDGDERLTKDEVAELLTIEPHFAVQIAIAPPSPEDADEYGSRISLASMRIDQDRIQSIVQHRPNRITITLGELALDIYAYDRLGRANFQGQAEAVLAQADKDQNAYLSAEEFSAVAPQFNNTEFDGVDTDQDGQLVLDELTNFFELRTSAQRGRINVLADDQQDALFPTLDRNHDGRIDSRELANVEDSLLSLDADGDGGVQLEELSGGMVLGVVRGANQADNVYQLPLAVPGIRDDAPRWFRGMDRNQDAGISWREFLGTRAQFDELDRDDDGFVDVHEAGSTSAGE